VRASRTPLLVAGGLAGLLAGMVAGSPAEAARPGDATRFDSWIGYEIGRNLSAVVAGDFDGDGAPDLAWGRDEFFEPTIAVTLNIGRRPGR
jgi:hypothetical protein